MSGPAVPRTRRDASATAAVSGTSTPAMTSGMASCCRPPHVRRRRLPAETARIRTAWYQWAVSRRVAFLVYDGLTLLDVAGPTEVFTEANRFGADYRIALVSPTG